MTEMNQEPWLVERYQALPAGERSGYALVSLKIKRFRTYNRLLGRDAGDALIEKVWEAIQGWLAPDEYAAYLRINYFNLLVRMPPDYEGIFQRLILLNRAIRDMPDERFHGRVFCGMGVCPLSTGPEDFYDAQYKADLCRSECPERDFRNSHFEAYGLSYREPDRSFYDLEQRIRPALDHDDFKLYLQPKVDLRTGAIGGAEALVRWVDPERGMIPLSSFLPGLEENGLIEEVDLYLFRQVCRTVNRWVEQYGKRVRISVNLSGCAFNYIYFFDDYKAVYDADPCPKECIEFELLERIVLSQIQRINQVVGQLRDFGFTCSLDDFGSGSSSYSVLTTANLSALKLDRSLFQHEGNPRERILLRHIVDTAHALGMETVAEGVESRGYVDFLREIGCDYVQGFVFYRPMPVEEFEARFLERGERPAL